MNELKTPEIEKEIGKSMNDRDDGILVKLRLKEIKPYPKNAKIHTEKQVAGIRNSMIALGYRDKIEVDENNVILAGHGRLRAWYQIDTTGMKKITVMKYKNYTESENKAYRIAHNKLSLDTGFDVEVLKEEFDDLKETDNFEDTGFEVKEITKIWNPKDTKPDETDVEGHKRKLNEENNCPNCGYDLDTIIA